MKLFGIDTVGNIPSQIIRRGNQFVRTKTLVTPSGNITAKLAKDTITIIGADGEKSIMTMTSRDKLLTPERAAKFLFENLERPFDTRYSAKPAIEQAILFEKSYRQKYMSLA